MSKSGATLIHGTVVEEEVHLTLVELCQACNADEEYVLEWVAEGLLEPVGESPQDWRFSGDSLRRARLARRLTHDLEIDPAGVALALDLLDEIAALRARLQRAGLE
jgi:chaperone modulatory protein CbpM